MGEIVPAVTIDTRAEFLLSGYLPHPETGDQRLRAAISDTAIELGLHTNDSGEYTRLPNGSSLTSSDGSIVLHTGTSLSGIENAQQEYAAQTVIKAFLASERTTARRAYKRSGIECVDPVLGAVTSNSFGYIKKFGISHTLTARLSRETSEWRALAAGWLISRQLLTGAGMASDGFCLSQKAAGIGKFTGSQTSIHGQKPAMKLDFRSPEEGTGGHLYLIANDPSLNPEFTATMNEFDSMVLSAMDYYIRTKKSFRNILPLPQQPVRTLHAVARDLEFKHPIATDENEKQWRAVDFLQEFANWGLLSVGGFQATAAQIEAAETIYWYASSLKDINLAQSLPDSITNLLPWAAKLAFLRRPFETKSGKNRIVPVSSSYPPVVNRDMHFDALDGAGEAHWAALVKDKRFSAQALEAHLKGLSTAV